jgi:hypothetical protein
MSAINYIGSYPFLDIEGEVPLVSGEQLRLIEREGVDGVFIMQTGERGKPFNVRTIVDAPNLATAMSYYNSYVTAIDSDPLTLTWHGLNLSAGNQLYQVLDVRPVPGMIRWVGAVAGGLNYPSFAICMCDWTLLPVVVTS